MQHYLLSTSTFKSSNWIGLLAIILSLLSSGQLYASPELVNVVYSLQRDSITPKKKTASNPGDLAPLHSGLYPSGSTAKKYTPGYDKLPGSKSSNSQYEPTSAPLQINKAPKEAPPGYGRVTTRDWHEASMSPNPVNRPNKIDIMKSNHDKQKQQLFHEHQKKESEFAQTLNNAKSKEQKTLSKNKNLLTANRDQKFINKAKLRVAKGTEKKDLIEEKKAIKKEHQDLKSRIKNSERILKLASKYEEKNKQKLFKNNVKAYNALVKAQKKELKKAKKEEHKKAKYSAQSATSNSKINSTAQRKHSRSRK